MSQKIVLELNAVSKRYKTELALKDISLTLSEGEILGFLGPSGAGKTTAIKIITGQLRQTSGEARILGTASENLDASIYEKIGVVSDNSGVYEKMTVQRNLEIFASILEVPKSRVTEVLQQTGLYEHRKKPAGKLSRGQGQRLVLARAVLHRPRILFLDEPTSGLDPATAVQIHEMLLALKKEGMAIFLTTHNMEEAACLCDRVALLCRGQIAELDSPEALCIKYNTKKQYRARLENNTEVTLTENPEDIGKLTEYLKENKVVTLHSCEPTLEQVFLQATGYRLNVDQGNNQKHSGETRRKGAVR